jgi:hypothetical protein
MRLPRELLAGAVNSGHSVLPQPCSRSVGLLECYTLAACSDGAPLRPSLLIDDIELGLGHEDVVLVHRGFARYVLPAAKLTIHERPRHHGTRSHHTHAALSGRLPESADDVATEILAEWAAADG